MHRRKRKKKMRKNRKKIKNEYDVVGESQKDLFIEADVPPSIHPWLCMFDLDPEQFLPTCSSDFSITRVGRRNGMECARLSVIVSALGDVSAAGSIHE